MNQSRKLIAVVSSCYNEAANLPEYYERLQAVFRQFPEYDFTITVADNGSRDDSRKILRDFAARDPKFRVVFNSANVGSIRSGLNLLHRVEGDAVVTLCSDLQDPPEMVADFVRLWAEGNKVVCGVKRGTTENFVMRRVRVFYYRLLALFSEIELIHNFYGFGLYDRQVIQALARFREPLPYFRGLISEIGFKRAEVPFVQPARKAGRSSYNFLGYYDVAMTGFVNHTKLPLRLASFFGMLLAGLSLLIAFAYLVYKLVYWDTFSLGTAPMLIGLFFFSAVQLIFIGVLGEYIGAIWTQVKNKPYAIEEETLNLPPRPEGPGCPP